MMATETEIKEFNGFLQESPVRNKFLPVMSHITKLKPKWFIVDEYVDKEGRTVVRFHIDTDCDYVIDGRVCFDWWTVGKSENVIFELWWDEENYCSLYTTRNEWRRIPY
jgi:hypothetical protein